MSGLRDVAIDMASDIDPAGWMAANGIQTETTTQLVPGTDYHDGELFMTMPLIQLAEVTRGKGKNAVTKPEKRWVTACVTSRPRIFMFDRDTLAEKGFLFPDSFTTSHEQRWPLDSFTAYINGEAEPVEPTELFTKLRDIYRTYVEYADEVYYDIVPLYVLASYVYRIFQAIGYLHFNGTAASGKSQNLRLMRAFGLNTTWASNMTTAALVRRTAGLPGVLCVDEAESFEGERGDELRRILNAGYLRGENAMRVEKDKDEAFKTVDFDTYTPKVIASINPLEPVIQSRCLVIHMAPALRPIPEFDVDDPRWADMRAEIYTWAMQHANRIAFLNADWNTTKRHTHAAKLQNRAWQIAGPIVILAEHFGGMELSERLVTHFERYFEQVTRAQAETDRQRLTLMCLPRVFATKQTHHFNDQTYLALKDIHEVISDYLEPDAREYYKTKQTSRHLSTLGWKDRKTHKGGTLVAVSEQQVREQLNRRRVTPYDEDLSWLNGSISYARTAPPDPSTSSDQPSTGQQEEMNWLDAYPEANEPLG